MRRRDFIGGIAGATAGVGSPTQAQQGGRERVVGVLMGYNDNDQEAHARIVAFKEQLKALGWREDNGVRFVARWVSANVERMDTAAAELTGLKPDVIVSATTGVLRSLLRHTRTIPIVFLSVSDPVGDGFVGSLAHPGGNATGFTNLERSLGGKWVELLKEAVPSLRRVVSLFNPPTSADRGAYYGRPFAAAATSLGMESIAGPVNDPAEIERVVARVAADLSGGLVVMPDVFTVVNRSSIVAAAAKSRVPAIYPYRYFIEDGGFVSYGIDLFDQYRRAAAYVDRIFRGEPPAALPVQGPAKFDLAVNLKTAKALGLIIPEALLARADEVIE
jgi:putative tryptophan/tyrosine transport system substrate-binding protein